MNFFVNNQKNYTITQYLFRLSVVVIFSLLCFTVFANDSNIVSSFMCCSISCFIITVFACTVLLRDRQWIWIIAIAFIVKFGIGLLHYSYFIDPNYFSGNGDLFYIEHDFTAPYDYVIDSMYEKKSFGLFSFLYQIGGVSHQELLSFISIPFYFFGHYALSICPLNSLFSSIAAINLILISKYYLKNSTKELKTIALLAAYFPATLISSFFVRDMAGEMMISIGFTLIILSKKGITHYLMIPFACFLFYMQRTAYPIVVLIMIFLCDFYYTNKSNARNLLYSISLVIIMIFAIPYIYSLSIVEGANSSLLEKAGNNIMAYPIRFVVGLIGPFPWFQWNNRIVNTYQLPYYLTGIFHLACLFSVLLFIKKQGLKAIQWNYLNIGGCLLLFLGIVNSYMHISYISAGSFFLIPWIISITGGRKFLSLNIMAFFILVVLNVLVIGVLGNLGISSLWKS